MLKKMGDFFQVFHISTGFFAKKAKKTAKYIKKRFKFK